MIEQRSEDWFKMREGRFTASDIVRLLGKEGLKTTNKSIDTFAFEKAVEKVYGRDDVNVVSFDMQRGVEQEPLAFDLFKRLKEYEFIDVKNCSFFPFGDNAGASPDGLVGDDSVLEIKCPRRLKFFKLVANGYDEIDSKYIAQMQMQMLCTNSKRCHFFNYYLEDGIEYWHEIIVERDDVIINLIKDRLKTAESIKNKYINKLTNNSQF